MAAQQNSNVTFRTNRRRGWFTLPLLNPGVIAGLEITRSFHGALIYGALMVGVFGTDDFADSVNVKVIVAFFVAENLLSFGLAFLLVGSIENGLIKKCKVWFVFKCIPILMCSSEFWMLGRSGILWMISFMGALIYSLILQIYCWSCVYEFIEEFEPGQSNNVGEAGPTVINGEDAEVQMGDLAPRRPTAPTTDFVSWLKVRN